MSDNSKAEPVVKETKKQKSKKSTESNQDPSDEKKPPPKPSKAKLYSAMSDHINRIVKPFAGADVFPEFPERFLLYKLDTGAYQHLQLFDNGIVAIVNSHAIVTSILKFTREKLAGNPHYEWEQSHAENCFKYWECATYPIQDEIRAVRWKDEPGLTFNRLAWDKPVEGTTLDDAPIFKEMFSRMDNADAVLTFIGSLFDWDSSRQQYLWIAGEGQDGKGKLLDFLAHVFGQAYHPEVPPDYSNRFWTHGLINKRIVAFDDCEQPKFVTTGLFKTLTGMSSMRVEQKGGAVYNAPNNCKFIFTSNKRPMISSQKADLRRLIYTYISPITCEERSTYPTELIAQGGPFLGACISAYRQFKKENPTKASLPTKTESLEEITNIAEEEFQTVFEQHFIHCENSWVIAQQVYARLKQHFKEDSQLINFKQYMERTYQINRVRKPLNGRRTWVYVNLKLNDFGTGE